MRTKPDTLQQIKQWAASQENIRVVLLTSSRANPQRQPDALSDYDIELFVRDVNPFAADDGWVFEFGAVMVRWPTTPQSTEHPAWLTQLVLYEDGVRLDFQITALPPISSDNLDQGYKILVDKDGMAAQLPKPTYTRYAIQPPTAQAFQARMNAFWWDIVYVAKALRRGELNYAKYMLDSTIRFETLQPLLEWYIGLSHEWSVNPGIYGRWFHQYLDSDTWEQYQRTFAGAAEEDNWQALFATLELFRTVGRTLAPALDFEYPAETDDAVTAYIQQIKRLDCL